MSLTKSESPQFALDRLDPTRISFARELRGLTKKQLADTIKKTPSAISQFERGLIKPDLETFVSLSFALKVPISFFMKGTDTESPIDLAACHFRSLRSTSQALRRQSARKGDMFLNFMDVLESKGVIFPSEQISEFAVTAKNDDDVERAASTLRRQWSLGFGPIPNIVRLVETKGIMVLPIHDSCRDVDAYSTWRGQRPCMFISYSKTASRIRFDVSHELGHLALHDDTSVGETRTEHQAHRFAGAFLAPKESFIEECPRRWNWEAFRRLKDRWKMSIQALLYRAKELGCISASTHRRAMIQLTMAGQRRDEGAEWPLEKPVLVTQAIELLQDQITLTELADELSIYPGELFEMLSQCVPLETLKRIDRRDNTDVATIVKLRD